MTLYLCAVKTITLSDNNMFTRFDASKSTKGASKLRRDLINAEIANLRDLLPLPPSTRQRLSQLQLMALVCVYVRKANYFQQAFKRLDLGVQQMPIPNIGFSKALSGFLMMMTQNGKLLYISDNAAEYLGHSMEDLLIHGDSVYDIIDKQDHQAIQQELGRATTVGSVANARGPPNVPLHSDPTHITCDSRMFLCRMNVSRNARRQMRFGDQKVVLVSGHFLSFLPLCSRNEPVFLATCTPIAMPETRECVVQGATNVFTSIHSMDMKFMHIDKNGEFYLEYSKCELQGTSWYRFLHWECLREAQAKHRSIIHNEQDRTCILLVRLQRRSSDWIWVHCVLQVKENMENSQQSVIVCTNQVLTEHEALVMNTNSWFYQYYMVQSKLQYSLAAYETHSSPRVLTYYQQDQKYTYMHNDGSQQQQHGQNSAVDAQNNQYIHRNTFSQNTGDNLNQHHNQQQQQQQQLHHQNQNQNQRGHQQHQHQRPCSDAEPVDYSVHANNNEDVSSLRSSPSTSISSSKPVTIPLYSKRRLRRSSSFAPLDLEPLRINGNNITPTPTPTPILTDIEHSCLPSTSNGDIILVPAATAVPISSLSLQYALARSRLTMKSVADPADCMEEWNPSPPWSDTLQKVPDITHHDLSSYSTTPPTPTSTPSVPRSTYMTFTFDWPPEQYVPSLNPSNVRHVTTINPDTEESDETICEHYYNSHSQNSHHSVASPASEEPWTRNTMNSSAQMSPSKCSQDSV